MPKITRHGGLSDTTAEQPPVDENQATIDEQAGVDPDAYDPGDYTVNEVNAYLDDCRREGNLDELERVQQAERAGKNRAGILARA